jgi:hypothetical protein
VVPGNDGLGGEAVPDLVREAAVDAGCVFGELPVDPGPAEGAQPGGAAGLDEQAKDCLVGHVVSQRLLRARVDVDEESSQPDHRRGAHLGEVVVVIVDRTSLGLCPIIVHVLATIGHGGREH